MHSKNALRGSGAIAAGTILLAIALVVPSAVEAATVTRGPYLQMGTPDRMVVRWRTDVPTDSRVGYGLCFGEPSCLIWEKVDQTLTTEHEVLLDGLAPNTRYYYAIGTTTELLSGNDSTYSFLTSPPVGLSKRTRIWVLGDSGTGTVSAHQVRDAYYAHPGSDQTDLWLMLGDNAYNRGTDLEYQSAVFNEYSEMLRRSVLWPSFGNHDGASAQAATQTGPYFDIFTLPRNAEAGGVTSGTEAYYSYDHANIHFVVLDSFGSDRSPDGAMLTWLRADLEANRQDWTIAYWHHPPYSRGSHNSNTETALRQMRQNALPILEDYGVDLVLAGHSHAYERSHLLDGHYGLSTTLVPAMILNAGGGNPDGSGAYTKPQRGSDPHKGTVYVVAGSSGKLSSEGTLNHPAMFISLEVLGSLVLTVNGNRLDAEFLQSTGTVRDTFTILKGSPSNIEVTPNLHAYGAVAVGTDAVHTFDVRNRGLVDLQVTPSLFGDAADEFSIVQGEAPFTIAPGETHTIDVRFAPMSEGPRSTLLRLTTDEPDQSPVDAALSGIGTTEPDIDVTLTALDYGDVLVGTTSVQTFTIQNIGTDDLELTGVNVVDGDATEFAVAEGSAPFIIAPGVVQNVDVRFAPTTGGPKTTTLRLTSNDPDEGAFDVTLSGTATTAPEIDMSPATHNYGVVWVGRDAFQTFVLRNLGSADLQILAAGLVGGDAAEFGIAQLTAPFTLAPGATFDLVVRFAPLSAGPKTTTVRLTSDDQDEPVVDLFVGGTAIMPPDVDVVSTPNYGDVVIGMVASESFIVRNLGGAELQVSGTSLIEGQAQEFALTQGAAPFVVAPGQTHNLQIQFAPASRGPRTTTLRLTSDDPDENAVDVVLSGNGLLPPDIDLASAPPDYGEVVVGTTASRPFVVRNLGDVELQVTPSLVNSHTGEFAIAQGTASFTVMPGATHSLDIQFAPSSGGPKTTTLRLVSDDQDEATIDVAVAGIGMMPADIELGPTPPDYGQVLVGAATSRTFAIRNLGDVALQAAALVVNADAAEFAVSPASASFTVLPGASHNVDVIFAPISGGPKATTLRLTSDDADEGTVDVALNGIGLMPADINLAATTHDYGQVVVGTAAASTIVVRNMGDVNLQVAAASLVGGEVNEFTISQGGAPFTVAPGATHTIDVRFAPASGGSKTTTLGLISDDADEPTVEVALSGIGLMPADIDLADVAHDYGQIVVGTSAVRTIGIRNLGDVDLHVTAANLVGGEASEFFITQGGAPFTVASGATHTLDIRFTPASGGVKAATLRFLSDDGDEATVDVALRGTGLMPPDIDLAATAHDYGPVVVGTTASRTVVIRNLGDVELQITASTLVNGEPNEFAITQGGALFTVAPGGTHTLDVRFAPSTEGPKTTSLRLSSNDADEPTVDVALNGNGLMPADIDIGAMTHDYGQVVVGTTASHTVIIRNLGDVALQVSAMTLVTGEAADFSITLGAAPFTVAPGSEHSVDVRFAPGSAGQKTTMLRVVSDDQDEDTVNVVVTGRGLMPPDIDLAPVGHDYGQAIVGTTAPRVFVIGNLGDVDLHVTAASIVGGGSAEFVLNDATAFTVPPGTTHSLEVRFVPTSGGPKGATLRLVSDDPNESTVDVPLNGVGMMPPDIDVAPMPHDYGDVLVGTTALRVFVIRNLGDVALQVTTTSLVGSDTGLFAIALGSAPFAVPPGGTHNLEVSFAPTSGGPKTATLRLTSDDSDESAVDVALSGTATTAPEVAVVLTSIHYGETLVGTTSSRTLTIENVGSADLHVTASLAGGEAGEFAIAAAPFTVAPGATHTIEVRFVPTSGGSKTTTLRLTSDDADEATIDVSVNGIGMMPADIDPAPMAHDFGDVLLASTASRTFTVRNLGDVNLQVTLAGLTDGDAGEFAVVQGHAPFTVAPGAVHNLDVRFAPVSAGPKTTRLRFTSDDQDESVIDVVLTGTATTAPELEVVTPPRTMASCGSVRMFPGRS